MKKFLFFAIFCLGIGAMKGQYTVLHNFNGTSKDGRYPFGELTLCGNKFYGMTHNGGLFDLGCIFCIDTNGGTFNDILDFEVSNGAYPFGSLLASNGVIYGMTSNGGAHNYGNVFSIDTNGSNFKDLLDFDSANGATPEGSLTKVNGILYGMTSSGGSYDAGCIFSIDTNGNNYKHLLDFDAYNGWGPTGSLISSGNKLFGISWRGGYPFNDGCIFSIDTNGTYYKRLYNFYPYTPEGYYSLTISDGKLYGMTRRKYGDGVIFSIDSNGNNFKNIFFFNSFNGAEPYGSLIIFGGTLYGMTETGAKGYGGIFSIDTNGINFTRIYTFDSIHGKNPYGSLLLSGTRFFGMTNSGGIYNNGVIFSVDTNMKDTSTLSINYLSHLNYSITIYPNPSTGIFTLQTKNGELRDKSIEVFNVLGERVLKQILRSAQDDNLINLSSQPNGVYFYRIIAEDGSLIGNGKLIIQK